MPGRMQKEKISEGPYRQSMVPPEIPGLTTVHMHVIGLESYQLA